MRQIAKGTLVVYVSFVLLPSGLSGRGKQLEATKNRDSTNLDLRFGLAPAESANRVVASAGTSDVAYVAQSLLRL